MLPDLPNTLPALLRAHAEARPHQLWCLTEAADGSWQPRSYRQLAERVAALARGFASWGLESSDVVGIRTADPADALTVALAVMSAGAQAALLAPGGPLGTLEQVARAVDLHLLWHDAAERPVIEALLALPGIGPMTCLSADGGPVAGALDSVSLAALVAEGAEPDAPGPSQTLPEHAPALCYFTDATEHAPTPCRFSGAQLVAAARALAEGLPLAAGERLLLDGPPAVATFGGAAWAALALGATLALPRPQSPPRPLHRLMEGLDPTVVLSRPRRLERLYHSIENRRLRARGARRMGLDAALAVAREWSHKRRHGLPEGPLLPLRLRGAQLALDGLKSGLRGAPRAYLSTGAQLPPQLVRAAHALDLWILDCYGMAETAGALTLNRPGAPLRRPTQQLDLAGFVAGSAGRPLAGVELHIEADEVVVRCPWRAAPLSTGDRGRLEEGQLFIEGRLGQRLFHHDQWLDPASLEWALRHESAIAEAWVHLADDQLTALIVPARDRRGRSRAAEVEPAVARVNDRLPEAERIQQVRVREEALSLAAGEVTASGRLRRDRLRA